MNKSTNESFNRPIKRKTRTGFRYIYEGKFIKRTQYWLYKIRDCINEKKRLQVPVSFNTKEMKQLLILLEVRGSETPAKLLKELVSDYYALIKIDTINKLVDSNA